MAKKYIDIMDTSFRDGFQSVFGGRVLMNDFFAAVEAAKYAGINHFEFGGGARFQSLFFYLNENAFDMMDRFREIVGPDANLQTLARGINTVMLDTGSRELIDLHAKLFAKHGTTTIRNFDALNDVQNLEYSASCIKKYGLNHEAVVTLMDLPPNCTGAHDVAFYEKTLRNILDSGLPFDSICFKDASGTSSPNKIFETIKMARKLLGEDRHIRLHTHETAGVSVACYLAALEAGADGIDLAASPVSGGTSQPDILTMLHATKGMNYDLGGLEVDKILKYEEVLADCLKDYFLPPEATQVSPLIPFSPMPGGALTANTQMMRDNGTLDKFPEVIKAMQEVVVKGGFGTSVTPVSQFYWQQAYANVIFGPWKQIAPGYGRMVLGYFGKTPVEPDAEIVKLASEKLKLEPTTQNPLDIADADPKKKISVWKQRLEIEGLETSEENIFIAAACDEKGITYLKGEAPLNVRKNSKNEEKTSKGGNMSNGNYTVVVDGQRFNVSVLDGNVQNIQVAPTAVQSTPIKNEVQTTAIEAKKPKLTGNEAIAPVNGNVWKILVKEGDKVQKDQQIMILEAMKMEIDVVAPISGIVSKILTIPNKAVEDGEVLAIIA
ncbi:2-oxoglutarate carboxylase large subunit [Arcobacter porcinus]|uniref:2-oxoglutarate carboxylase large subunit n=1 Tax=Arcobacter porcinus TaxID=1935204 RepID=A0ABX2YDT4_9BACT|nr:biotin/lipoyl-containing protein [Arcobacter porcinus]OCL85052.1 2-oxoglutarate carboxylase large subunit [Arcobacter porcinus]OCL93062.1 2-oxoglutarate carboxylase large subunit [Arcobacter porcinus]